MSSRDDAAGAGVPDFLTGGGEMGALMRAHDWAATPLGPPEGWPRALKTTVRLILNTGHPMYIWWGPDLLCFYNDAYCRTLGPERHPGSLGQPGREVWAEIWPLIGHQVDFVMAGQGSTWDENRVVPITRFGKLDEIYWTYSYSPIDDEAAPGGVGGVLVVCTETTQAVLAERRRAEETERQRRLFEQAPGFITILTGPDHVFEFVNAAYRRLFGDRDYVGKTVREAFPELMDQDFFDLLDRVYASGERFIAEHTEIHLECRPGAGPEQRYLNFIYEPVVDEAGKVTGIFVEGHDITEAHRGDIELRANADRQAFRLKLEERLRDAAEPADAIAVASEALGRQLGAAQVAYGEIEPGDETVLIEREWNDGRIASNAGRHRLNDYGPEFIADLRRGATVAIPDIRLDPRTSAAETLDAFARVSIQAFLNVPVVKAGRLTAILAVHDAEPRAWSPEEVALAEEIADRTWAAAERTRAEASLRESEQRLRASFEQADRKAAELQAVLESMPDAVYIGGAEGITLANQPALDQLGFASPEELNRHVAVLAEEIHTRDATTGAPISADQQAFSRAFAGERVVQDVIVRNRASGEDRVVRCAAAPVKIDGQVIAAVAVNTDVTEKRRSEARLAYSEEQLRLATEAAEIGLWDVDPITDTLMWPPRVKAMFGISPGVPVTMADFYNGLHPDDREHTAAAFAAACDPERRAQYDVEYRTVGKEDGIVRWVAAKGRGLFDAEGVCTRVIGTAIDITERKADEVRLRELNDELEQKVAERTGERNRVWEMSREMLAIMGFDGHLKAINPAWETILGRDTETLLSRSFREQVHPDDHPAVEAMMERLLAGETVDRFEDRLRHADGSWRWISWTLVPEGDVFYAVGRDVTAEKQAAAELEHAQEALRQSQKMEAMGQLTGGVAHDFNNLLTPIVGSLDMLQRKGLGGEREQRLIEGAMQSADRAKTLVQRLLAFARRQPLQPTAVDVAKLVTGMADLVASTSGPQIHVVVETADSLPTAKADPNQLEMALLNLGVNARDAMPDGGTLRISAGAEQVSAGHRSRLPAGEYIRLSVADTGVGMDEATQKKAIEPFFSTKGIGKGTGLGLSMVHGLASQLGGALTIESRLGVGTNVELWLPLSDAPPQAAESPALAAPSLSAKGTALLVDDEELVRMSTADMLSDIGYSVVEASSAEEALRLIRDGVTPDLVITDHLMPGMNGTELAQRLRAERPDVEILIVSGYAETEGVAPDLPRLTKPFRRDDLAAKLLETTGLG